MAKKIESSIIQAGQKFGMRTMNQSLHDLYIQKKINQNDALGRSTNVQELEEMMNKQSPRGAASKGFALKNER